MTRTSDFHNGQKIIRVDLSEKYAEEIEVIENTRVVVDDSAKVECALSDLDWDGDIMGQIEALYPRHMIQITD